MPKTFNFKVFYLSYLRFMGLSKPAEERREKLQESLVLYRFLANVDEELAWIRDKEPLVKSDDLGRNLIGTTETKNCQLIFGSNYN